MNKRKFYPYYGMIDYLMDCNVDTFRLYLYQWGIRRPSHSKLQKELLKEMQERLKVLS